MTDKQAWARAGLDEGVDLEVLNDYIRLMADLLELRDWTIIVSSLEPDNGDDCHAEINVMTLRKFATIRLASHFRDMHPRRLRHVVAHELVHCHLQQVGDVICHTNLNEELPGSTYHLLSEQHRIAIERATDAIAEAVAPGLPLIDWDNDRWSTAHDVITHDNCVYVAPHRPERAPVAPSDAGATDPSRPNGEAVRGAENA